MKHKFFIITLIIVYASLLSVLSCTEKIELNTETFEDVLVVEATITNEFKIHEIKLSRTYQLESDVQLFENNANVKIEDSNQNVYNFHDTGEGVYKSDIEFQAIEGVSYKLIIATQSGKQYISSNEFLTPKVNIDNLYAELISKGTQKGIQVFLDSENSLGNAQFFRYEYEETYKIVTPYFSYDDAVLTNVKNNKSPTTISYDVSFVARPEEQRICYSSDYSTEIILTNVNKLSENKVSKFPIRFINQDNSILRDRYSILVKQYVQSADANNYYRILKELGGDVSLFLDNQPGFIKGNIISQQNQREKVIGYFDVSSVDSKRIYFNFRDFEIPDMPPYFYDCNNLSLDYQNNDPEGAGGNQRWILFSALSYSNYKYVKHEQSVYDIVNIQCGDCTSFSSSVKPDFWEE